MSQFQRPPLRLEITVVYGASATQAYEDGERDLALLGSLGRVKTYKFQTVQEMNAFIMGVEDATGFLDSLFIEE